MTATRRRRLEDRDMAVLDTVGGRYRSICGAVAASLALSAALLAGCSTPRIISFTAAPRRICPETKEVALAWSVDGNATLGASSGGPPFGDVPPSGQMKIPAATSTVTLTASKFFRGSVRAQQVLAVVKDGEPITIAPDSTESTCDGGRREVIAALAFEGSEYDERVVIKRLVNPWNREIAVVHRGRIWTVPPGATADLAPRSRNGLPDPAVGTAGTWILRAPLLDGERCGDASALPALRINLIGNLGCREELP
jgi:hypothetical protein